MGAVSTQTSSSLTPGLLGLESTFTTSHVAAAAELMVPPELAILSVGDL